MEFRIADTFTDSLARLTRDEQKAVKTTAFDMQLNPANPGLSFHRIDKARDKSFWSVRVNKDIRLIVHKNESSLLLCYVDHHDKAYEWAERRKLEVHSQTGAAQLVEIRETVQKIIVHDTTEKNVQSAPSTNKLFADIPDEVLLKYGVPAEWLKSVKELTEDTLLVVAGHLPAEAAEALLELATGGKPREIELRPQGDPFTHPDALRRFRLLENMEELQQALDYPWDKWAIFLHPDQRQLVTQNYFGPARVSGSAGTGKTIVALHRAVFLTRNNPDARVLLTTFSPILANALSVKLRRLISAEPSFAERLDIYPINEVGIRLFKANIGSVNILPEARLKDLVKTAAEQIKDHKFSQTFLLDEWKQVVDAWQLERWEDYRDVKRLGRKTRLSEQQRALLWSIFARVKQTVQSEGLITYATMFTRLAEFMVTAKRFPYDYAIIDESQDLAVYHVRFLAALAGNRPNALFFAGDLGQRIFNQPFSWKLLGIDVRGRSKTLHVNYRTSHQIRRQADFLLNPELTDVDGNIEARKGTISVFNGPSPEIKIFDSEKDECNSVASAIKAFIDQGLSLHEMGIFVRSTKEIDKAVAAVKQAGYPFVLLDETVDTVSNKIAISTMHLAKGLEFKAVVIMACDEEVIPSQERIENVSDSADLEDVYSTERHLLYVACTRARDYLLITCAGTPSEFLQDFGMVE